MKKSTNKREIYLLDDDYLFRVVDKEGKDLIRLNTETNTLEISDELIIKVKEYVSRRFIL